MLQHGIQHFLLLQKKPTVLMHTGNETDLRIRQAVEIMENSSAAIT